MNKDNFIKILEQFERVFKTTPADLKQLVDILIKLTNVLHEKQIKVNYWKTYIEILLVKFTFNVRTIITILEGQKIQNLNLIDISSLGLQIRSLIENYLTFYYLYVGPQDDDESECKFAIYKLSGIKNRVRFPNKLQSSNPVLENDLKELDEIKNLLKGKKFFRNLKEKLQKQILGNSKHNARLNNTWNDLIKKSGLRNEFFLPIWSLYSNYAHSEYISLDQLLAYYKNYKSVKDEQNKTITLLLTMIISKLVKDYCELFSDVKDNYDLLDQDVKDKVEYHYQMAIETSTPNNK